MSLTGWLSFLAVLLSISAGLAGLAWAAGHVFHALRQAVRGWRIDREMKAMHAELDQSWRGRERPPGPTRPEIFNHAIGRAVRSPLASEQAMAAGGNPVGAPTTRHDAHAAFAVHNETIARLGLTGLAHAPRKGQ
jgi:hypothetical protein